MSSDRQEAFEFVVSPRTDGNKIDVDPVLCPLGLGLLAPRAIGAHVGIYDPDLDPDGHCARLLTAILVPALHRLGTSGQLPSRTRGLR